MSQFVAAIQALLRNQQPQPACPCGCLRPVAISRKTGLRCTFATHGCGKKFHARKRDREKRAADYRPPDISTAKIERILAREDAKKKWRAMPAEVWRVTSNPYAPR